MTSVFIRTGGQKVSEICKFIVYNRKNGLYAVFSLFYQFVPDCIRHVAGLYFFPRFYIFSLRIYL